jgi:NADPH:quinone reductase
MRAMLAEKFGGYRDLKLADIPNPAVSGGQVLVRMTAAGVTPVDYTILSVDTLEPRRHWCSAMRVPVSSRTPASPGSLWE